MIWDNNIESIGSTDLCIIDDWEFIYLYIGSQLDSQLIYDIFGVEGFDKLLECEANTLDIQMDTDAYFRVVNVIEQLRSEHFGCYQPVLIVCEGSKMHDYLKKYVCIDSQYDSNKLTHRDFLAHLKSLIK